VAGDRDRPGAQVASPGRSSAIVHRLSHQEGTFLGLRVIQRVKDSGLRISTDAPGSWEQWG